MIFPLLLIALGIVFFARALGFLTDVSWNVVWPLALIVIGLAMLSHKTFGHACNDKDCWRCSKVSWNDTPRKKR